MDQLSGEDEVIEKGRTRSERRKRLRKAAAWLLVAAIIAVSWALGGSVGGLFWLQVVPFCLAPIVVIEWFDTLEYHRRPSAPQLWTALAAGCLGIVAYQAANGGHFRLWVMTDGRAFWNGVANMRLQDVAQRDVAPPVARSWAFVALLVVLTWLHPLTIGFLSYSADHIKDDPLYSKIWRRWFDSLIWQAMSHWVMAAIAGVIMCYNLSILPFLFLYLIPLGFMHLILCGDWPKSFTQAVVAWTLAALGLEVLVILHALTDPHYVAAVLVDWSALTHMIANWHALFTAPPQGSVNGMIFRRVNIPDRWAWGQMMVLVVLAWWLPFSIMMYRSTGYGDSADDQGDADQAQDQAELRPRANI